MRLFKQWLYSLGQTVDFYRPFDPDYFLPKEWKGKTIEQRAALMIADSYQEGIRLVRSRRPELAHVEKAPTARVQ